MATNKNTAKTPVKKDDKKTKKSDSEKFAELANVRVPKALRVLKSISSLANDDKYEYTEAQSTSNSRCLLNTLCRKTSRRIIKYTVVDFIC